MKTKKLKVQEIASFFQSLNINGTFKNENNAISFEKIGHNYFLTFTKNINLHCYQYSKYYLGHTVQELNDLFKLGKMQGCFKFLKDNFN